MGLRRLIDAGELDPGKLIAIIGKTKGNVCVTDFTRAFAVSALTQALGENSRGVSMVMSSGTEGGLSPHIVTIEVLEDNGPGPPMAIGTGLSRDHETHELGTFAQIDCVAETVSEAVKAAYLSGPADVHFIQVKCPLLTADRITAARSPVATTDTLKSMALWSACIRTTSRCKQRQHKRLIPCCMNEPLSKVSF